VLARVRVPTPVVGGSNVFFSAKSNVGLNAVALGSIEPGYINTFGAQASQWASDALDNTAIDRVFAFSMSGGASGRLRLFERGAVKQSAYNAPSAETIAADPTGVIGIGGGLGGVYFLGDIYEIVVIGREITEREMRELLPWMYRHQTRQFICMGNSIMEGYPVSPGATPFMQLWQNALPKEVGLAIGLAVSGIQNAQLINYLDARVRQQVIPGVSTLFFWEDTNAIGAAGDTLQMVKDRHLEVKAWCDAAGVECAGATVLPNYNFSSGPEAVRTGWNSEALTNPQQYFTSMKHFRDLRGNTILETPGNYFGGVHPNTVAATELANQLNTWARALP
jgi:hypothetical protein